MNFGDYGVYQELMSPLIDEVLRIEGKCYTLGFSRGLGAREKEAYPALSRVPPNDPSLP
jgi:hypothetical protein